MLKGEHAIIEPKKSYQYPYQIGLSRKIASGKTTYNTEFNAPKELGLYVLRVVGGEQEIAIAHFSVGNRNGIIQTNKNTYQPNEKMTIDFSISEPLASGALVRMLKGEHAIIEPKKSYQYPYQIGLSRKIVKGKTSYTTEMNAPKELGSYVLRVVGAEQEIAIVRFMVGPKGETPPSEGQDDSSTSTDDQDDFCKEYARRTVEQAKENLRRGCYPKSTGPGKRWIDDYEAHYNWCKGVSPALANSERDARDRLLDQCKKSESNTCNLTGTWYSKVQRHEIKHVGNRVTATYYKRTTGELIGSYSGTMKDGVLDASWTSQNYKGTLRWRFSSDCKYVDDIKTTVDGPSTVKPEVPKERGPDTGIPQEETSNPPNTTDVDDPTNLGKTCADFSGPTVYIECRKPRKGDYIRVPVYFCGARDLANMDFYVTYNTSTLDFQSATKGSLSGGIFDYKKVAGQGKVNFSFATGGSGANGDGTLAILYFKVLATRGSSTISGYVSTAQNSDGNNLRVHGRYMNACTTTVVPPPPVYVPEDEVDPEDPDGPFNDPEKSPGGCDCDGNGYPDSYEARAAVAFGVGKSPAGFSKDCLDVNRNGKTNSEDARLILQGATGKGICGAAVRKKWGVNPGGRNDQTGGGETGSTGDSSGGNETGSSGTVGTWVLDEADPTKYSEVRDLLREYLTLSTACLRKTSGYEGSHYDEYGRKMGGKKGERLPANDPAGTQFVTSEYYLWNFPRNTIKTNRIFHAGSYYYSLHQFVRMRLQGTSLSRLSADSYCRRIN